MKVQDVMTGAPCSCKPTDALVVAARIMWEDDCGCVPVVDDHGALVGMVTDRDACMAAYTRGRRLDEIQVGSVMARQLCSCSPEDSLSEAERYMQEYQVRRLPVVDAHNRLVGVLSCNDLIRHAAGLGDANLRTSRSARLLQVLSAIGASRPEALPMAGGVAGEVAGGVAGAGAAAVTPAAAAAVGTRFAPPTPAAAVRPSAVIPAVAPTAQKQQPAQGKGKKSKSKGR